jgi:superoxide reductase
MPELTKQVQTADWKKEKHVPVIDAPDSVKSDEFFAVKVALGREVAHPNTTEHHIAWIALFFQPEGDKFTHEIGRFTFSAHGASTEGPNTGPVYTHHEAACSMKTAKPGTLQALAYCNIHGLWQSTKEVKIG